VYRILDKIDAHFPLKDCFALEAFAYKGALQAVAYRHYPKYHEAWEISDRCEPFLRKNLPGAEIKITNSFEEILRCDKKFNFINVDTHQGIFGEYCENFEFFPLIFRVMQNDCVVNLNVIPDASKKWKKSYPGLFNEEHLRRRSVFYKTADPENISFDLMLKTYGDIASEHNYSIVWHERQKRSLPHYLATHFRKNL
jgi:hypothetical protein